MKKKRIKWLLTINGRARKLLMIMKLTFVLVFTFVLGLSANTLSQQKVNLKMGKTTYEKVFEKIKEQTGHYVIYNNKRLNKDELIEVNFVDVLLETVLEELLKGKDLVYVVKDEFIIFKPAPESFKEKKDKKPIKGKVVDSKGNPLPGVSILIKGTIVGVATDVNGKFLIVANKGDLLEVSFMGMKTKRIKLINQKVLNIVLEEQISKLDEVVITGYSTIDRHKVSSSVVSVKAKDVLEVGGTSIETMLQGKIPGLAVINPTGTPGAATKFRIRGSSSITGNREPVWVVDGIILEDPVKISAAELNSLDNVNLIGNAISSINPEDIERIDVLKDASATAIYGTKAANGVIVITTKEGKRGKPSISFTSNTTINLRPTYASQKLMNSAERIDVCQEIRERGLCYGIQPQRIGYEGLLMDLWDKNITETQFNNAVQKLSTNNTDWFDILCRNSVTQSNTLSISGANDKSNYYVSIGYADNQGVVNGEGMSRLNALAKIRFKFNRKADFHVQLRANYSKRKYLHSSIDAYGYANKTSRALPCYNEDGSLSYYTRDGGFYQNGLLFNVINEINNSGRGNNQSQVNFMTRFNYQINSWLRFENTVGGNIANTDEESWIGPDTYFMSKLRLVDYQDWSKHKNVEDIITYTEAPYGGQISTSNTKNISMTFRNALLLNKSFGIHSINAMFGTEYRSTKYNGFSKTERGYLPGRGRQISFIDPAKYPAYRSWLNMMTGNIVDTKTSFLSFYTTLTYSFANKCSFNFNCRADGSNKFGQDKSSRFQPIWSVSGRWNLHNLSWMENVKWLNNFSIRASYGIQGNVHPDASPNLIAMLGDLDAVSDEYNMRITHLRNPGLKQEKTESQNIGIDLGLFKGRISGTFEYYYKKGTNQIISKRVSSVCGRNTLLINSGDIENKGLEGSVRFDFIRKKDFDLSFSIMAYKNRNRVLSSNAKTTYKYYNYLNGTAILEGKPVDGFYSYQFGGLDSNGLPTFKEIDPQDGITKEERYANMFVYSGSRLADVNGGFNTHLRFKRLSISMNWAYSLGRNVRLKKLYESSGQRLPRPDQNMDEIFTQRWKNPGDEAITNIPTLYDNSLTLRNKINGVQYEDYIGSNFWQMYNDSDINVVSGDFLRLRSIQLRYQLPTNICKKMKFKDIIINGGVSNILLISSKKLRGLDPEFMGLGSGVVPVRPSFTLGVNVRF